MKGALARGIFDKKSPHAERDFAAFIEKAEQAQKAKGVELVLAVKRKISDSKMEIMILPAGANISTAELKSQGFEVSTNATSSVSLSGIKAFAFEKEVSFEELLKQKKAGTKNPTP